jgi:hypothetical protein
MFFTMLPFHGASARGGQRRRTFWVAPEPLAIRQCEFGFKDRCLPIAYQTIWFHAGKYKGSKEDAECNAGIARMPATGQSWGMIQSVTGCSRPTIAKRAKVPA